MHTWRHFYNQHFTVFPTKISMLNKISYDHLTVYIKFYCHIKIIPSIYVGLDAKYPTH